MRAQSTTVRRRTIAGGSIIALAIVGGGIALVAPTLTQDNANDPSDPAPITGVVSGVQTEAVPLPSDAPMPEFSGPYAARFESAYRNSTSDLQRQVLEDGLITEQEMSALRDDVLQCITDAGIEGAYYEGGSLSIPLEGVTDEQVDEIAGRCQELGFGTVDILYNSLGVDPQNIGEAARLVPCLQRAGLVDSDYTTEDYTNDMATGQPPFDLSDPAFVACIANPDTNP